MTARAAPVIVPAALPLGGTSLTDAALGTVTALELPAVGLPVVTLPAVPATLSGLTIERPTISDSIGAASATTASVATSFHVGGHPRGAAATFVTGLSSAAGIIALGRAPLSIPAAPTAPPSTHGLGALLLGGAAPDAGSGVSRSMMPASYTLWSA